MGLKLDRELSPEAQATKESYQQEVAGAEQEMSRKFCPHMAGCCVTSDCVHFQEGSVAVHMESRDGWTGTYTLPGCKLWRS